MKAAHFQYDDESMYTYRKIPERMWLQMKGEDIVPDVLWNTVAQMGGLNKVRKQRKWQKVRALMKLVKTTSSGSQLNRAFDQYFGPKFSEEVLLSRSNKTRGKRRRKMEKVRQEKSTVIKDGSENCWLTNVDENDDDDGYFGQFALNVSATAPQVCLRKY